MLTPLLWRLSFVLGAQAALRGQVEFRTDKRGTIRCGIGKVRLQRMLDD